MTECVQSRLRLANMFAAYATLAISALRLGARADVGTLYGALALAGVSYDMQNACRGIPADLTRSLNSHTANRIAEQLKAVDLLINVATAQLRTLPVLGTENFERLYLGVLENVKGELDEECLSTHIDPLLCEAVGETATVYAREKMCVEAREAERASPWCASLVMAPVEAPPPARQPMLPPFRVVPVTAEPAKGGVARDYVSRGKEIGSSQVANSRDDMLKRLKDFSGF